MVQEGKHHNSALCHISTILLTRIVACWRSQSPYVVRDIDGTVRTPQEGRIICHTHYRVSEQLRAQRRTTKPSQVGTSRRKKESTSAPTIGSSPIEDTTAKGA
jgi:hypothetical protein